MSDLSVKLVNLKGRRKTTEILSHSGISRETFRKIERGASVKLSTLKEIATSLGADEHDWLELLVAWLKHEAGTDALKLWIETKEPSIVREAEENQLSRAMMLFEQLNHADRMEITKAMERPEVRSCLPAINRVWEKLKQPFNSGRQLAEEFAEASLREHEEKTSQKRKTVDKPPA